MAGRIEAGLEEFPSFVLTERAKEVQKSWEGSLRMSCCMRGRCDVIELFRVRPSLCDAETELEARR